MTKQFKDPVRLQKADGEIALDTIDRAIETLSATDWPNRGARHRDALDICLKVRDGHRSIEEARSALVLAAQEADNLAGDHTT